MIQFKKVYYQTGSAEFYFDATIASRQFCLITGENGAGKSTFFNLLMGFCAPLSGEIWVNNQNVTLLPPAQRQIALVFQENNLFHHLTVKQNLALALSPRLKLTAAQSEKLSLLVNELQLFPLLSRKPPTLSGGQQQKIAIARALLQDHPILLLDEPFSALDKHAREEIATLLHQLNCEKKLTILMISHQTTEILPYATEQIEISQGQIQTQRPLNIIC